MIALIQRVSKASVSIKERLFNSINAGYLVLLGVKDGDTEKEAKLLAEKTVKLRIMADDKAKMNLSIMDSEGEILVISQFTLYADLTGGRRPSFIRSARPEVAEILYKHFISELKKLRVKKVVSGEFGAHMSIEIINDGPVTIIADSDDFL